MTFLCPGDSFTSHIIGAQDNHNDHIRNECLCLPLVPRIHSIVFTLTLCLVADFLRHTRLNK